jgi:hypothetical protein
MAHFAAAKWKAMHAAKASDSLESEEYYSIL